MGIKAMRTFKCDYQEYLINSTKERFPKVTHKNITEIVKAWEQECNRGRAQSDDTQLLHAMIKNYFEENAIEYNTKNLAMLGHAYYQKMEQRNEH
jgi:hypothetical protein